MKVLHNIMLLVMSLRRCMQASPFLSRQEAIASSAVRAADKVGASLIIVYTGSGQTASLVSKYRRAVPSSPASCPATSTSALSSPPYKRVKRKEETGYNDKQVTYSICKWILSVKNREHIVCRKVEGHS